MSSGILVAVPEDEIPIAPIHPIVPRQHLTLLFGVREDLISHLIGREIFFQPQVHLATPDLQVLTMGFIGLPFLGSNRHTHITISHTESVKPIESNHLLTLWFSDLHPNPESVKAAQVVAKSIFLFTIEFQPFSLNTP